MRVEDSSQLRWTLAPASKEACLVLSCHLYLSFCYFPNPATAALSQDVYNKDTNQHRASKEYAAALSAATSAAAAATSRPSTAASKRPASASTNLLPAVAPKPAAAAPATNAAPREQTAAKPRPPSAAAAAAASQPRKAAAEPREPVHDPVTECGAEIFDQETGAYPSSLNDDEALKQQQAQQAAREPLPKVCVAAGSITTPCPEALQAYSLLDGNCTQVLLAASVTSFGAGAIIIASTRGVVWSYSFQS